MNADDLALWVAVRVCLEPPLPKSLNCSFSVGEAHLARASYLLPIVSARGSIGHLSKLFCECANRAYRTGRLPIHAGLPDHVHMCFALAYLINVLRHVEQCAFLGQSPIPRSLAYMGLPSCTKLTASFPRRF